MKDKNDIGTRLTELQVERERLMGELENARIEARDALIVGQETRRELPLLWQNVLPL